MNRKSFCSLIIKKVKNTGGETLSETIVSILIIVLSLTMLAVAISSAKNIVTSSRERFTEYYGANENVVLQSTLGGSASVTSSCTSPDSSCSLFVTNSAIGVNLYVNDKQSTENPIISYKR